MTQSDVADYLTSIYCPECGDEAEDVPPACYVGRGIRPEYRHVSDGTALCPVITRQGYRPVEPVEHQLGP